MRSPAALSRHALHATARDRADLLAIAASLAVPRAGERCWLRVAATDWFDAWLISWGAGSAIEPHDHGASAGALQVVRGCLLELSRDRGSTLTSTARELGAGAAIEVPRGRVHQLENPGPDPALSLHVYSPPLTGLAFHPEAALGGVSA